MDQSVLVYSNEQVETIKKHWSVDQDTCRELPDDDAQLYKLDGLPFVYTGNRLLLLTHAEMAMDYIRFCCQKYPFNIRYFFAHPMWLRFCEMWNDTGDIHKALGAI